MSGCSKGVSAATVGSQEGAAAHWVCPDQSDGTLMNAVH